jgi:hypothetical protein
MCKGKNKLYKGYARRQTSEMEVKNIPAHRSTKKVKQLPDMRGKTRGRTEVI